MKYSIFFFLCFVVVSSYGQENKKLSTLNYEFGSEFRVLSNNAIPFWLRTQKFGAIPINGVSGFYEGSISKEMVKGNNKLNWGFGLDGFVNYGNKINGNLTEAYLTLGYAPLQLKLGRSKDIIGLVDSTLSSGSFSISGNALGIPKIEISIPDYTNIPFTKGLFSFKGNFSYGIIGNEPIAKRSYIISNTAFTQYHQKSLYIRIGKEKSRVKLYGGFNHNVTWGDENKFFKDWNLSAFSTFVKVVTGGVHKDSKVGNHLGSIDQQIDYRFNNVSITGYHQFFYEVGGLFHLNNIKDGLWGISFKNHQINKEKALFAWNKILIEFFASKSQGGELDAKITPSGDEDYYNNYLYLNGWRYKSENLGSNFITNRNYLRNGLPQRDIESHSNNRLYLAHVGVDMNIGSFNCVTKLSYSKNFGTYGTSSIGNSTGIIREIQKPPYFPEVNQFSGDFEINRPLRQGWNLGVTIAVDRGQLLTNSAGGLLRLRKQW